MHKLDPVLWEKIDKQMGPVTWFGSTLRAFGIPLYRCPWWSLTYRRVRSRDYRLQNLGPSRFVLLKFKMMNISARIYTRLTRSKP
jgi:hypothetical protein